MCECKEEQATIHVNLNKKNYYYFDFIYECLSIFLTSFKVHHLYRIASTMFPSSSPTLNWAE